MMGIAATNWDSFGRRGESLPIPVRCVLLAPSRPCIFAEMVKKLGLVRGGGNVLFHVPLINRKSKGPI